MSSFRITKVKLAILSALTCSVLTGCENNGLVRVKGQVVEDGAAYRLAEGETIQIDFLTADNAYPPLALGTFVKRDGSFVVDMNDGSGRGLPPGKYKVRLNSEGTSLKKTANAKLFKEPCTLDVGKGASLHLAIDLAKGTITP